MYIYPIYYDYLNIRKTQISTVLLHLNIFYICCTIDPVNKKLKVNRSVLRKIVVFSLRLIPLRTTMDVRVRSVGGIKDRE